MEPAARGSGAFGVTQPLPTKIDLFTSASWQQGTRLVLPVVIVALVACSRPTGVASPYHSWVGEVENNRGNLVITNRAGYTLAERSTLRPIATIGLAEGPDEYMLGRTWALAVDRQHVVVVDPSVPRIGVYDHAGVHLFDLGRAGQGPGEFLAPDSAGISADGRIIVRDRAGPKFEVFGVDGTHLDSWRITPSHMRNSPGHRIRVASDGTAYMPGFRTEPDGTQLRTIWAYSEESTPSPHVSAPVKEEELGHQWMGIGPIRVPFAPEPVWATGPDGALVKAGRAGYSITLQAADGTWTTIRREADPVPTTSDERDWHRRFATYQARAANGTHLTWQGPDIPSGKPFVRSIHVDQSGRIWVLRPGPGKPQSPCDESPEQTLRKWPITPCWVDRMLIDVVDADGRLATSIADPDGDFFAGRQGIIATSGDVVARSGEHDGIYQVRLYRLEPQPEP